MLDEIGEAEQFFELIDDDQQILVQLHSREAGYLDQAQAAAPQRGLDHALRRRWDQVEMRQYPGFDHGPRQKPDGVVLWSQDGDSPVRTGTGHEAALQRRQQPGPHERRLATAGGADDGQKPPAGQAPHQLVALPIATEEKVRLLLHEGPKARERVGADAGVHPYAPDS